VIVIPTSHIAAEYDAGHFVTVAQSQLNSTAVTKYQFTHESTEKNQLMKL